MSQHRNKNSKNIFSILIYSFILFSMLSCSNKYLQNPILSGKDYLPEKVSPEDYKQAFEEGIEEHKKEIKKIVENKQIPDYANTIQALDDSGLLIKKTTESFFDKNQKESTTTKLIDWFYSTLPKYESEIYANKKLALRVKSVYDANIEGKESNSSEYENLNEKQRKQLESYYYLFFKTNTNK